MSNHTPSADCAMPKIAPVAVHNRKGEIRIQLPRVQHRAHRPCPRSQGGAVYTHTHTQEREHIRNTLGEHTFARDTLGTHTFARRRCIRAHTHTQCTCTIHTTRAPHEYWQYSGQNVEPATLRRQTFGEHILWRKRFLYSSFAHTHTHTHTHTHKQNVAPGTLGRHAAAVAIHRRNVSARC